MIQRFNFYDAEEPECEPDGEWVRVSDLIEALEEADLGDFVAAILAMKEPVKP